MINASRLLVVLLSISFTTIHTQNNSLDIQNTKDVTRVAVPSKKKKFFGALKNVMSLYIGIGMATTIFCGYLWLVHEVNSPENIIKINDQQAVLKPMLDQAKTAREVLRVLPQLMKWEKLEFFKNIDFETFIGVAIMEAAALGYLIFSGAEALS